MRTLRIYWIIATVAMTGCTVPEYLDEEGLQQLVLDPSYGLTETKKQHDYQTVVSNRPTGLLLAQQLDHTSKTELEKLRHQYDQYYYFTLSLSKGNKEILYQGTEGLGAFSGQLNVLAYGMGQFLNMTTSGGDTIPMADYTFSRTFGMGTGTQLMAVFDKSKASKCDWVQLNLNELGFGLGNQRFRFRVEDLENVPKLDSKYIQKQL